MAVSVPFDQSLMLLTQDCQCELQSQHTVYMPLSSDHTYEMDFGQTP